MADATKFLAAYERLTDEAVFTWYTAALSLVFPRRTDDWALKYSVFARCYLNEAAVLEARSASYPRWAAEGFLTVTEGNETDFSRIEDDLLEYCRRFRVLSVAYDPWAATQFAQRMQAQGVPMVEFRATTQNFSEPSKELDAAMRAGRVQTTLRSVTPVRAKPSASAAALASSR